MALVRAGDTEAFTRLYERHRTPAFTFLVRLTGDHHLAEDLLQETFLRVYQGRGVYQPSGQFRTWLFTIARHLVIDHHRRHRIAWEHEPAEIEAAERAQDRVEARELLETLERALSRLSPAHREIVLLSRIAGMSADEVASVTGSTAGAVRVALHRALRRLASLVGPGSSRPHAVD